MRSGTGTRDACNCRIGCYCKTVGPIAPFQGVADTHDCFRSSSASHDFLAAKDIGLFIAGKPGFITGVVDEFSQWRDESHHCSHHVAGEILSPGSSATGLALERSGSPASPVRSPRPYLILD
jgi:hypothetical protein